MKKKQFAETKGKPVSEMQKLLGDLRDRLWQLKMDLAAGKVKNVREIRATKRSIAQVFTLLHGKNTS